MRFQTRAHTRHFYPRSSRGERLGQHYASTGQDQISIHAPREGSDISEIVQNPANKISIHAPREGSDLSSRVATLLLINFYPRSPRGERRFPIVASSIINIFLSTLPARGATCVALRSIRYSWTFLSTLPARGATVASGSLELSSMAFLSTLPARGATGILYDTWDSSRISIHAPREGSDPFGVEIIIDCNISIHAPREGSDQAPASAGGR